VRTAENQRAQRTALEFALEGCGAFLCALGAPALDTEPRMLVRLSWAEGHAIARHAPRTQRNNT